MTRQFPSVEVKMTHAQVNALCLIAFVVLFVINNTSYRNHITGIFTPLLGIFFLYGAFKGHNYKILEFIGRNSLEIYILHIFFVMPFKEVGDYILSLDNFPISFTLQLSYSLFISVLSILLSVTFADFFKKNNYISKLIFGK